VVMCHHFLETLKMNVRTSGRIANRTEFMLTVSIPSCSISHICTHCYV
jgi:hypothetical protein